MGTGQGLWVPAPAWGPVSSDWPEPLCDNVGTQRVTRKFRRNPLQGFQQALELPFNGMETSTTQLAGASEAA